MSGPYDKYRVRWQRLMALCKRNLGNLEPKDREIVLLEASVAYRENRRGQKRRKAV